MNHTQFYPDLYYHLEGRSYDISGHKSYLIPLNTKLEQTTTYNQADTIAISNYVFLEQIFYPSTILNYLWNT